MVSRISSRSTIAQLFLGVWRYVIWSREAAVITHGPQLQTDCNVSRVDRPVDYLLIFCLGSDWNGGGVVLRSEGVSE